MFGVVFTPKTASEWQLQGIDKASVLGYNQL